MWQRIFKVRSLVIRPEDDLEVWLKYTSLCRNSGRISLSRKILLQLMSKNVTSVQDLESNFASTSPLVSYAFLKHFWIMGQRKEALAGMRLFAGHLNRDLGDGQSLEKAKLLAKTFLRIGKWELEIHGELKESFIGNVLDPFSAATQHDQKWYKAWHSWAFANFQVISFYERLENFEAADLAKMEWKQRITQYVIPALQGFFRSISLSKGNSLQDTLRLLSLWFKFGSLQEVHNSVQDGFESVSLDTWLQVIPQLIARIHIPSTHIRRLVHELLSKVGKEHPQALIYSLTVTSKSSVSNRRNAASSILDKLKIFYPVLADL